MLRNIVVVADLIFVPEVLVTQSAVPLTSHSVIVMHVSPTTLSLHAYSFQLRIVDAAKFMRK